jgi:ABC-type uncharacterized transport system substrate-binding protein
MPPDGYHMLSVAGWAVMRLSFFFTRMPRAFNHAKDGLVMGWPPLVQGVTDFAYESERASVLPNCSAVSPAITRIERQMRLAEGEQGASWAINMDAAGGISTQATDASGKRLALLKEMLPGASRVAVLWNRPSQGSELVLREFVAASKALNLEIMDVGISSPSELPGAFEETIRSGAAALAIIDDPVISGYKDQIGRLMVANKIPCSSIYSYFAVAGGLLSYGPKLPELYRHAARYVDRILRGVKPSELPVEQPTIFELVINVRTAKAFGIDIPATLLARTDEVIE